MDNKLVTELVVKDNRVRIKRIGETEYISLTDLAKYTNEKIPSIVIVHWLSRRGTLNYIGLWEELNNPEFNFTEFRKIKTDELPNSSFTLSPRRWIKTVNARGIISQGGRYSSGVFAHPDIAFEFASWLSPEFKLYLIKEFERLKKDEAYRYKVDWQASRLLSRMNYLLQTAAIRDFIVPDLSDSQKRFVYADEADVLNVALFGMTAKEWREKNPELAKTSNIRDHTDLLHLIILGNMENTNANMIRLGMSQEERIVKLNELAKVQAKILASNRNLDKLAKLEEEVGKKFPELT